MAGKLKEKAKLILVRLLTIWPMSAIGEFFYRGRVTVFFMHRVGMPELGVNGHSAEFLKETLQYLKNKNYTFVSLRDLIQPDKAFSQNKLKKAIAFTIDDGFFDQAELAAPIFIENQCPVTIFLVSGFIDGKLWPWDDQVAYVFQQTVKSQIVVDVAGQERVYQLVHQSDKQKAIADFQRLCKLLPLAELKEALTNLSRVAEITIPDDPPEQYKPLTWEQARMLEPQGVSFGPHSYRHSIFSRLSIEQAEGEITESIDRLSVELDQPLPIFAWPTGRKQDFNEGSCRLLAKHGIEAAFSTEPGNVRFEYLTQSDRRYLLKRMPLPTNLVDVIQYASWVEPFKEDIRAIKRSVTGGLSVAIHSVIYWAKSLKNRLFQRGGIDWVRINRLVFVCKGNVCRSPYAEFKAIKGGINAVSLGIHANSRISANDEAIRQATLRGIDLMPHITRPLHMVELEAGDLVVCMEPFHAEAMQNKVADAGCQMTLLGLWAGFKTPIIPDPYGHDPKVFQACFEKIDASLQGLTSKLISS